jgi:hypothetical protein
VRILPTSSGYSRTEWLNTNQGRLTVYQGVAGSTPAAGTILTKGYSEFT